MKKARDQKEYKDIIKKARELSEQIKAFEKKGKYLIGYAPVMVFHRSLQRFLYDLGENPNIKVIKVQKARSEKSRKQKVVLPELTERGNLLATSSTKVGEEALDNQVDIFYNEYGRRKNKADFKKEIAKLGEGEKQAAFQGIAEFKKSSIQIPEAAEYIRFKLWTKEGKLSKIKQQEGAKEEEIQDFRIWRPKKDYIKSLTDSAAAELSEITYSEEEQSVEDKIDQDNRKPEFDLNEDLINSLKVD